MLSRTRLRSLAGVIAAMAVVHLVYSITFPLMALVLDSQGVSKSMIGLSTIVQAAATLVVAPIAPGLMTRFAPSRIMQVMTVALALLIIIAGLYPNVWFWFPLRLIIGAATALLWIASEILINELALDRWRGRIIAIYISVGSAGFALGPLLLIIIGSEGMAPFVTTSVITLLAGLPLFFVMRDRMEASDGSHPGVWKIFLLAPVIMLANVAYASAAESMLTFFPLFGMHMGISKEFALALMTIMATGSMILILPLGWVADHVNRMGMLVFVLLVTMAGLLAMPYAVLLEPWQVILFVFTFGGIEGMIYALGVVLIGERFKGTQLAAATTAFTACWGVGTMLGPLLVGFGMDWFGNESMVWIICAIFAVYLPLPIVAWWRSLRH